MKKISLILTLLFVSVFVNISIVNAASATIAVKSSNSQVVVGKTIKVTVTLSSKTAIGAWEFDLNYNKSNFSLVSGPSLNIVEYATSSSVKSKSYTYTFKAIKSGSAKFYIDSSNVIEFVNESSMTLNNGSTTVKVITQADLEATYSKDNYLKSLEVVGYTLDKTFNKDETNYKVTVPTGTKKITLKAAVNDSKSSMSGTGEIEVSEGTNTLTITVTAQNGNERKYNIVIDVIDTNPIKVTIDNVEYTIVKNKEMLINPSNYEASTTLIDEIEVPALYNEITDYTLVGLKDSEGNISLFIHSDSNYIKYQEIKSDSIVINPLSTDEVIDNYQKYTIEFNDLKVPIYKLKEKSNVGLIYGIDVETGKKGFYVYDIKNKTLQLYDDELNDYFTKLNQKYFYVIVGVSGFAFLLLIILLITLSKNKKNAKIIKLLEEKRKLKSIEEKTEKE